MDPAERAVRQYADVKQIAQLAAEQARSSRSRSGSRKNAQTMVAADQTAGCVIQITVIAMRVW